MARRVTDIEELQEEYFALREQWLPILPPDPEVTVTQPGQPAELPFDPKRFPEEFLKGLAGIYENSVVVYPVTMEEDPLTRETVFVNGEGQEICAMPAPKEYDPFEYVKGLYPAVAAEADQAWATYLMALYDPARIRIEVKLVALDDVEPYLYAAAKVEEAAEALREEGEEGGGGLLLGYGEGYTNHLWVGVRGPAQGLTNIEIAAYVPEGFTNRLEIFTCTNLLSFWWDLAATNLSTEGTNVVYWGYDVSGVESTLFFAVGNADVDTDGDGLADAREKFMHHTEPDEWDTDGDGVSDGEEVAEGTDPLDRYSNPPLDWLRAEGSQLVDESGRPVVLKSVNLGGWLEWEQWMLGFEPRISTNSVGMIVTNDAAEADLLEWTQQNLDGSVVLMATNYDTQYRTVVTNWNSGLNDYTVSYVGSFDEGDYLGFTGRDFGPAPGVSNLAIGIAVPDSSAGKEIQIRLNNRYGPIIGTLTTRGCGPNNDYWVAFTEQHLTLTTNLVGTQTVFIVAASGGGGVGNLFRFRFYRDDEKTREAVRVFQDNYLTTNDLDRLWQLGYNCVRLPFYYRLLEDDHRPYVYKTSGWARLDWVIEECRKRRLWVILDLHGAPGGVNGWASSGDALPFRNRMWKIEHYKDRTEKLWGAIAARYATNSAVAGYDLINEPAPYTYGGWTAAQAFSNDVLPVMRRLYRAVRSNDTAHVVFVEGNTMGLDMWGQLSWWPRPVDEGWSNVVYEFHVYDNIVHEWGPYDDSFTNQKAVCDRNIRELIKFSEEKQVPVFLGEFQPGDPENHDYAYRRYTGQKLSWAHWNWRVRGWMDPSRTNRGWTGWGLQYRNAETKDLMPHLQADSFETLTNRMLLFSYSNYNDHVYLQQVVKNEVLRTGVVSYCEFYVNTFSSPNGYSYGDRWPWRKLAAVGHADAYRIAGGEAKLSLGYGVVGMRLQSREEADARFQVNDAAGSWFEVWPLRIDLTNVVVGPEAEVRVAVVRDEVTNAVKQYNCPAITARLEYDVQGGVTSINLSVYAKTNGVGTYGAELFRTNGIAYSTNATLRLHVTSNLAEVVYGGVGYISVGHGLKVSEWPEGAVCVVEAENRGGASWVYMDDLKAWREGWMPVMSYEGSYTNAPDGMMLRAWMEDAAVERTWSVSRDTSTYITNGKVVLVPWDGGGGKVWLNARRSFHEDVRLDVSSGHVGEVEVGLRDFTDGYVKVGLMPEYYPGYLYDDWNGIALYLEMQRVGPNIKFTAFRTYGTGAARTPLAQETSVGYSDNDVVVQVSSNWFRAYYGTTMVVNAAHGVTNYAAVYPAGMHVHVEYQSPPTSSGQIGVKALKCRMKEELGL